MSATTPALFAMTENPPDAVTELVVRARGGDREAYGDLVERLWAPLVRLARGILATDLEAEDVVQDALVAAWGRLWMLRRPESFDAWMRRIVARRCLSRRRTLPPREPIGAVPPSPPPAATDRLEATRLLARLPRRQRAVVFLTWIEGCTDREAGRLLGLRPSTVRVHRCRGLERLRQLAEELP